MRVTADGAYRVYKSCSKRDSDGLVSHSLKIEEFSAQKQQSPGSL